MRYARPGEGSGCIYRGCDFFAPMVRTAGSHGRFSWTLWYIHLMDQHRACFVREGEVFIVHSHCNKYYIKALPQLLGLGVPPYSPITFLFLMHHEPEVEYQFRGELKHKSPWDIFTDWFRNEYKIHPQPHPDDNPHPHVNCPNHHLLAHDANVVAQPFFRR